MKGFVVAVFMALGAVSVASAADRPYSGLETRAIKALSSAQIDDLRSGRGMGLALAAELNNYPGPRHVLDLSDEIGLSPDQHRRVSDLFEEMATAAKRIGARIVGAEKRLDDLFAHAKADDASIRTHTAEIAALNGQLRYLHLRYHVEVRALMSDRQISRYTALRGYRGDARGGHGTPEGGHHGQGMKH